MSSYGRSIAAINKELDRLGAVKGYANSLSGVVKRLSSVEIDGGGGSGSEGEWELLWENEDPSAEQDAFVLFDTERMAEIKQKYSKLKICFQPWLSDGNFFFSVREMFMDTNVSDGYGCEFRAFSGASGSKIAFISRNVLYLNSGVLRANVSQSITANLTDNTTTTTNNTRVAIVVAVYGKKVNA